MKIIQREKREVTKNTRGEGCAHSDLSKRHQDGPYTTIISIAKGGWYPPITILDAHAEGIVISGTLAIGDVTLKAGDMFLADKGEAIRFSSSDGAEIFFVNHGTRSLVEHA